MTTHIRQNYLSQEQWNCLQESCPVAHLYRDNLYLDIETTGLNRERSILYMIGAAYYDTEERTLQIIQWFNDDGSSEEAILLALSDLLGKRDWRLVTYNGDGFDLPWLEAHYHMNGIPCPLSDHPSIDLYKELKPYLRLFGLSHGKQKDWEAFLGIHRDDRYSGGALIQVYREYLKHRKMEKIKGLDRLGSERDLYSEENLSVDALLSLLLLHNREDVEGLAALYPLIAYPSVWKGDFTFEDGFEANLDRYDDSDYCTITIEPIQQIPKGLYFGYPETTGNPLPFELNMGKESWIRLPVHNGILKHFLINYKDYYYLPEEDRAVHKSIGIYVDRKHRRAARPSTCYAYKEGSYLPVPLSLKKYGFTCGKRLPYEELFTLYKKDYSEKRSYIEITDLMNQDRKSQNHKVLKCYLTDILHEMAITYINIL